MAIWHEVYQDEISVNNGTVFNYTIVYHLQDDCVLEVKFDISRYGKHKHVL
jgi:hypothetical protein